MKSITITFERADGVVGFEANGCEWDDYLTALSLLARFIRGETNKPARLVDAKILLATARGHASENMKGEKSQSRENDALDSE